MHLKIVALFIFIPQILLAKELGLKDLIRIAEDHQLNIKNAVTDTVKAKGDLSAEKSKFLPSLEAESNANYGWQENLSNQERIGSSAALVSRWSVYDNGTSFRDYKLRKLEFERAKVQEKKVRADVAFEVLSRYSRHLLYRRERDVRAQKLTMLETQFRLTERLFRQGLKTVRDYQRLQTEVERGKLSLMRLEDQVWDSFEELKRYLGGPSDLGSVADLKIVSAEQILESLKGKLVRVQKGQLTAPAVTLAKFALEISGLKTREAQAQIWPRVDLSGEVGYGSDDFIKSDQKWADQERMFAGAQLQLRWTLFDWGSTNNDYRNAKLDERILEAGLSQAELDARTGFRKFARQSARQEIALSMAKKIFDIERKTYKNIEVEYREGRASYLDLITSLERLSQAEIDYEEEVTSYYLVLAETLELAGELHEVVSGI